MERVSHFIFKENRRGHTKDKGRDGGGQRPEYYYYNNSADII